MLKYFGATLLAALLILGGLVFLDGSLNPSSREVIILGAILALPAIVAFFWINKEAFNEIEKSSEPEQRLDILNRILFGRKFSEPKD